MPREPLEAILLVGGQGTRLRPLTLSAPKPLLPTAGVPFLAHLLARSASCGVTHVVLATCYKSEMFAEAFGDGSAFGLSIDYVQEDVPLDTGGGIRNAAGSLRSGPADPVVVLNSDILSGHDLSAQVDLHRKHDAAATLHLVEVPDPSRFGVVPTDESGRVTAFLEKTPDPVTNRINAGCYVFRREIIDQIPAGRRVSVERETFPELIAAGELVMGYPESAYWIDVGTPQTFVRGSCDLVLGKLPRSAVPGEAGPALLLAGAHVAPDASVTHTAWPVSPSTCGSRPRAPESTSRARAGPSRCVSQCTVPRTSTTLAWPVWSQHRLPRWSFAETSLGIRPAAADPSVSSSRRGAGASGPSRIQISPATW